MPKKQQSKAKEAAASPVTKEADPTTDKADKPEAEVAQEHQKMQFRFHNTAEPSVDQ